MIAASFAVALCEGEVQRLGRIWADGQLLDTAGLTLRFYRGTEDQGVDSLIEAKQGGNAPAYRGLCYLVFERLPLAPFGNRIPNIAVELCRVVGELEPAIRAVTVIPGATEFGYDPVPRVRVIGPGVTANENTHRGAGGERLDAVDRRAAGALPQPPACGAGGGLVRRRPALRRVPDRAAGRGGGQVVEGTSWAVAGLTRETAGVVSSHDGGPAYGGTPSDAAVLAAIADLKARGLGVTLYPLVMMDIAAGNPMGQPPYPVARADHRRRRMAPGRWRRPCGGGGDGDGWGLRRMVRHYAELAVAAGGVDALVIGSEMRGMTPLRDGAGAFPFVDCAGDAGGRGAGDRRAGDEADLCARTGRSSPGCRSAATSSSTSIRCGLGRNIDAVGIDNYMPVATGATGRTRRCGDAGRAVRPRRICEPGSRAARGTTGTMRRTPIASPGCGRRSPMARMASRGCGGSRTSRLVEQRAPQPGRAACARRTPTAWVPGSKPIWFTELGCGAVDKGANQPNVFGDPKSAEDGRPYFSTGAPDPLMQRQVLRAHLAHWATRAIRRDGRSGAHLSLDLGRAAVSGVSGDSGAWARWRRTTRPGTG